jgi:hypothetical protein
MGRPLARSRTPCACYFRKHFVNANASVVSVVGLDGKILDPASISMTKPLPFPHMPAAIEHSAKSPAGAATRSHCARCSSNATPTRLAASSRIQRVGSRYAPTGTRTCWKRHSPGLPSTRIRLGVAWPIQLLPSASKDLSILRRALREFFSSDWLPATGVEGRICELEQIPVEFT